MPKPKPGVALFTLTPKTREATTIVVEQVSLQIAERAANGPDKDFIRDMKTLVDCVAKMARINFAGQDHAPEPTREELIERSEGKLCEALIELDPDYAEFKVRQQFHMFLGPTPPRPDYMKPEDQFPYARGRTSGCGLSGIWFPVKEALFQPYDRPEAAGAPPTAGEEKKLGVRS